MTVWLFPGQGSQQRGMGTTLFDRYADRVAEADAILGYSLRALCEHDADGLLDRTDHTQPALFAVCALEAQRRLDDGEPAPAAVAGHSLGEYAALYAAGVFDFATGVRLVRERGRLMNEAREGGMAAVVGADAEALRHVLDAGGHDGVDVANFNAPAQIVLSGPAAALDAAALACQDAGFMVVPLKVSAAFHSRLMAPARETFATFLAGFDFAAPRCTVLANASARPYPADAEGIRELLLRQITSSVRWVDAMQFLRGAGHTDFVEVGPGGVLTKLMGQIEKLPPPVPEPVSAPPPVVSIESRRETRRPTSAAERLGSEAFRRAHNTRYAYFAGSMYKAIASPQMVIALGRAGMLGFLGVGGVPLADTRAAIASIRAALPADAPWGVNLLADPDRPEAEMAAVEAYLAEGVHTLEASAFVALSPSIVRFRYAGARRRPDGGVELARRVVAKVSRTEVAGAFLRPTPDEVVDALVERGLLSEEEAWCARRVPVASDLCAEADSGGHTDGGSPFATLPAMLALRARTPGAQGVRVGAAGGIGTPEAVFAALMLGADFVCTGSINQCTVEAGTSDAVKDILQGVGLNDFAYAPAGDMFELGAQVQVVRKGLFFPARARRLYDLYRHYDALEAIPEDVRRQIAERFFGRPLDTVWQQTREWLAAHDAEALARAEASPKYRMALVFRRYFHETSEAALAGRVEHKVNFQIHSGPALGAFNAWVQGTLLESWRARHVADIGQRLLDAAADLLEQRLTQHLPAATHVAR